MEPTVDAKKRLSTEGLLHLLVVYVVWSSTYLAMRITVDGGGFTPFAVGATRLGLAWPLLLLFAAWRGYRIALPLKDLLVLAISGVLLWVGGNGMVMWAEQRAHSGFAALVVASSPIWTALFEAVRSRCAPSWATVRSLLIGFTGVIVLMWPALAAGELGELSSSLALLFSAFSWSLGSFYQANRPVKANPIVMSAYQQLFAAGGFVVVVLLLGEPMPQPTAAGWLAWGFLLIFGSLWAFTSFVYAIRLLPLPVAMTYAYVNPALALALGWWLLDEPVTGYMLAGAALVIVGVVGIFRDRYAGFS